MATDKNFVVKNGLTINGSEIITSAGAITASADISVVESSDAKIISNSVGDYFPSLEIKRTSGSSKTNYHWLWQLGSSGFLNLVDNTNSYYPVIFKNNGDVALANNTSAASPVLLLDQSAASATFSGTISSGDITASGSSGAVITAEHDGGGLAADDFIGAFLFKNNDSSGTEPHYAGITARANSIYGAMKLEFFADRDDYENDTPALVLSSGGTSTTTNSLSFESITSITGVTTITASGEIEGGSLDINGVADISGNSSIGSGTQTNNGDANLTIREGDAFAGFDFKSTRTSGNIGGLRFYNTSSDSVPKTQFLIETDGSYNFYNGSSGAQNRLKIDSSGNVGIGATTIDEKLHLEGSVDGGIEVKVQNNSTGTSSYAAYQLRGQGNNLWIKNWGDSVSGKSNQTEFISTAGGSHFQFTPASTEMMVINTTGVGIGTTSPQTKLHIEGSNVGIPTTYGGVVYEAVDAQVDIISDSSGTWGSAINFVEGASTSANTDVWSIARKTTGGAGDSSLNFNFGTGNAHDNTARVIFSSAGNVGMASGHSSGKFAVMTSSVHGSYDFYNNGTTYLNGATTIDSNLTVSSGYLRTSGGGIFGNMSDEWQTANALRGGNFSADIGNDTTVLKLFPASLNDESGNIRAASDYSTGIAFMHLDPNNSTWGTGYAGAQAWIGLKLESTPGQEFSSFVIATNSSSTAGTMPTERFKISSTGAATFTSSITATGLDLNGNADISGSLNMSGNHIYMNNYNIYDINTLSFNDPGPNEGISWDGGNTRIYESPDDLTTNTAGNLQFVYGSTRRLTVNSTGIDVNNTITTTYVDAETLKANDSGATPGSCKLHVGSVLSAGSSAVAQLGGFIRMSDQLIIHSGTSANTVFIKYNGGNIDLTEGEGSGANPATIVNDLTSTARGTGWTDHVNLVSSDGTNKWNLLVDNGASDYLRFGYNSTDQINFRPDGTIQCDKLIANEADSEFFVAGSANSQTIVATIGSTSLRPVLQFSESTSTAITSGMSIEYDGRGSGDTNYMAINSVSGANVFKVYSGGDVYLKAGAKLIFNNTSQYGIGAGGHNYNSGYFDTVESGLSADPLELVYYQGRGVNIGPTSALKNLGCGGIKIGGADNTIESGYMLHLESTADAAILIEADTDNVTEGDNPKVRFRQDGGAVEAQIMLTANNDFLIDHIYTANDILFGFNGVTKGTMTNGGNLTMTGNVTAYSDERLKTNIETLDPKKTLQMRGVSFEKEGVQGSGVIAQELEKVAPELVLTNNDEMKTKSVAYGNLVGYLIETIKEQQKDIDKLKEQVSSLTPKN